MFFPPSPCYFTHVVPHPIFEYPSLCSSLNMIDRAPHPYQQQQISNCTVKVLFVPLINILLSLSRQSGCNSASVSSSVQVRWGLWQVRSRPEFWVPDSENDSAGRTEDRWGRDWDFELRQSTGTRPNRHRKWANIQDAGFSWPWPFIFYRLVWNTLSGDSHCAW